MLAVAWKIWKANRLFVTDRRPPLRSAIAPREASVDERYTFHGNENLRLKRMAGEFSRVRGNFELFNAETVITTSFH